MGTRRGRAPVEPPTDFQIARKVSAGRHPLLHVFPEIDRTELAGRQVPDPAERARFYAEVEVELADEDLWMYVAPRSVPTRFRRTFNPVISPEADCVVVGLDHLRTSPALVLYMDIFHELCHVLQRRAGRELFPTRTRYVRRSTEIDAYRFVIEEARRLDVDDGTLRDYLRVEWISDREWSELCERLGVSTV